MIMKHSRNWQVFFADTLKFFLSLYGHKLPVLCMDISSDAALLVSGSADINLKIWGLDFALCLHTLIGSDSLFTCFIKNISFFQSATLL